jgi:DNA adenine methylase
MTPASTTQPGNLVTQAMPLARPFLKWVGGKGQLLSQFEAYFPSEFQRYFEPFVGGGAVFFHLWNTGRLAKPAFLFDTNPELVNAYQVVRDQVDELIEALARHKTRHNREYYYAVRSLDRNGGKLGSVERAARTLYLNKTCYNGLYRVNSKGLYNVPMGSYKRPKILNEGLLRAASIALQGAVIEQIRFDKIIEMAREGDFFYFDPPYVPLSKTANFTGYTAGSFGEVEQRRLAGVFRTLAEKGCLCMLSNSYTPLVLELYRGYRIERVMAKRAINSKASRRGAVPEAVVLSY